jgi:nicotinamide-nucleotide amidase
VEVVLNDIDADLAALAAGLRARGWMLASAESCTGGLIAAACTALAGSSDWFDRGVVSYSNEAKTELLGVPAGLIAQHGAVSAEVVRAMADGMLARSKAQLTVAVTGIAGPGGGSPTKPVGTVWVAIASRDRSAAAKLLQLQGDRDAIRRQTVAWALHALRDAVGSR